MCCGSKRAAAARNAAPSAPASAHYSAPYSTHHSTNHSAASLPTAASAHADTSSVIVFEYIGTALPATVPGPVSGRRYRFLNPGDRQAVDPRDRPGMAAMPMLRWVR